MYGFRNPMQYNNIQNINYNNMVFKSHLNDIVALYNNIITIY